MRINGRYRIYWIAALTALVFSLPGPWRSPAHAEGPTSGPKGPEVTTVGTDPYQGPLPEEIAKAALVAAEEVTAAPQEKEPVAATFTTGGAHALNAAEQAKLVALLANPVTLPMPDMPKLEPMEVPSEGIPPLTSQEIEKHARELATPPLLSPPASQPVQGSSR